MRILYISFLSMLLSGCLANKYYVLKHYIEPVNANELGLSESYRGALYKIICYGRENEEAEYVDYQCRKVIAEFVYSKNHDYFVVLDKESSKKEYTKSYRTKESDTNVYKSTVHRGEFLFLLVNSFNKNEWNNYYIVTDYYTPIPDGENVLDATILEGLKIENKKIPSVSPRKIELLNSLESLKEIESRGIPSVSPRKIKLLNN
ncbi:MAG: hypothetical protein LBH40_05870 [Alphaproteobacteria bacterium]|jgi:hypothetical protein|nr:hypothetical protein [Alphaproteobacteria bacterium]